MADRGQAPLDPAIEEVVECEARRTMAQVTEGVIQLDDLCQLGRMGALDARQRFDPRHGVHFKDFARHRIRGSMFDGLRSMGLLSRRIYARLRQDAIDEQLVGEPVPDPPGGPTRESDARIAFQAILELATARIVALEEPPPESQEDALVERDTIHKVRQAVQQLSEAEQRVVRAIYDLDETGDSGAQMADRAGVSRSSISRKHRAILERLRRLLKVT